MEMSARPLPSERAPSVICLAGPTGTGKTRLALILAAELGCEIVNADSRQVYASFPLITAQPSEAERAVCTHHLYGFLPTRQKISAGQWLEHVLPICRDILARGKTPLLVGGTGFYFEALLNGFSVIPQVPPEISAHFELRLAREGTGVLYQELSAIDPVFASRIHIHDRQRIQRGLEVYEATGRPLSWWHLHNPPSPNAKGPLLVLKASPDSLLPGLEKRIEDMLAAGAVAEVKKAFAICPEPEAPGWSGIGCAELLAHIQGRLSLEEAKSLWLANTRAYAKRQLTWFRARKNAIWIDYQAPAETALKIIKSPGSSP